MAEPKASRWIPLFEDFIKDLRIASKEVSSTDERGAPLDLWRSQHLMLTTIASGLDIGVRKFYFLKSRQVGATTLSLAIDLFWLAMHRDLFGALVTDTEKNRDANRMILTKYLASFPEGYFGEDFRMVKHNREMMAFSNGARLDFVVAGTKKKGVSWAEGRGYAMAHLTECSKYGDAAALDSFEESMAQENPDRLYIYESTANGMNHWKSRCEAAKEDTYTKRFCFIGWWAGDTNRIKRSDPRFLQYGNYAASGEEREQIGAVKHLYGVTITPEQLAWIRWKYASPESDAQMLAQNLPWTEKDAFVQSGYSFFQVRQLGKDQQYIAENPEEFRYRGYRYELGNSFFDVKLVEILDQAEFDDIELRVWEEPVETGQYAIGCDPAWGRNAHKDRHAIVVWRCYADKLVQVAEYATADVEPKHAAWVLAHLAGAYRNCIVNLELQGPGRMYMQEWDNIRGQLSAEMFRDEVRSRDWEDALGYARWYLYHRSDSMGAGYAANFETTWRTKQELMFQFRGAYVTSELIVRSIRLLREMVNVQHTEDTIGAPESTAEDGKDDRVFAGALGCRAWLNWIRPSMLAQGQTYEVVMREERGERVRQSDQVMRQVYKFFVRRDQLAQDALDSPPKTFLAERGLA
jgi:hypothetical protein